MKPNILFICTFVFFLIGCKTGGVRVGEDSTGKIIKPKTIEEIKKGGALIPKGNPSPKKPEIKSTENIPNGNIAPEKDNVTSWEESLPQPYDKIKIPAHKSKPDLPDIKIAEPKTDNFKLELEKANLELSQLDFSAAKIPLLPSIENKDKVEDLINLVPAPDFEEDPEDQSKKDSVEKKEEESKKLLKQKQDKNMKINWTELFLYYFLALLIIIIAYITYDILKQMRLKNEERNPFARKPAKKIRPKKKAAPKKAVKKAAPKKAAKKSAPKKAVKKVVKKTAKKKTSRKRKTL